MDRTRDPARAPTPDQISNDAVTDFFGSLLDVSPPEPDAVIPVITATWRRLSGASCVWLWMKNTLIDSINEQWALCYDDSEDQRSTLPDGLTMDWNCFSEYSNLTQRVVRTADFRNDRFVHNGCTYRCGAQKALLSRECKHLEVIPVLAQAHDTGTTKDATKLERELCASICLHYRHAPERPRQNDDQLLLMGRMTARALKEAFQYKYLSILVEMNNLAACYLTKFGTPRDIRSEYLDALIKLIQKFINVKTVSIFYERPFTQTIDCISTTGLYRKTGDGHWTKVKDKELFTAKYSANEGLTGKCYASGKMDQKRSGSPFEHHPKYIEIPGRSTDPNLAFLMMPIRSGHDGSGETRRTMGVIRLSGHTANHFDGHDRNFDPIDAKSLEFIADQAAPVLETFDFQIRREHSVSVIKHELDSPLKMISDTSERAHRCLEKGDPIRRYDLLNIRTSSLFAANLVPQLDVDPHAPSDLNRSKTYLEGDIVARVKAMLSYYADQKKKMTIEFEDFRRKDEPDKSIPPLWIDRDLVERALCNLIINAIKYGDRGSRIVVSPFISAGQDQLASGVYVEVSNYGFGVEDNEKSLIFEPYYRSNKAKSEEVGAGLGLAISRKIMRQHGGRLQLVRAKDPTIFQMYFPKSLIR